MKLLHVDLGFKDIKLRLKYVELRLKYVLLWLLVRPLQLQLRPFKLSLVFPATIEVLLTPFVTPTAASKALPGPFQPFQPLIRPTQLPQNPNNEYYA